MCYILIGVFTGVAAFLMSVLEEFLMEKRTTMVEKILENTDKNQFLAWLALAVWCFTLCAFASFLTTSYGPGAMGSGIVEIMAYMNGVNFPKLIGWGSFNVKTLCTILGIAGGLCIGKEGPLA